MPELEDLPTKELHDRAMKRAAHHMDVEFLWRLVKEIPAAEAVAGNPGDAEADAFKMSALLTDLLHAGDGELAEALRPVYLEYLHRHDPT